MANTQVRPIPTQIPGLDTILGGGFPMGSLIMLVGAPGTGKTILLQQLAFAWVRHESSPSNHSQKALYFSTLSEPHDKLMQHLSAFSFFDKQMIPDRVEFLSLSSVMDGGLDKVRETIVETTRRAKAGLVVIDSFAPLAGLANTSTALRKFLYTLSTQIGLLNATTIISIERTLGTSILEDELAFADGLIGLYSRIEGVRELQRMEVRKLRGLSRLRGLHTYRISQDGLTFYPRLEELVKSTLAFSGSGSRRLGLDLPELESMLGGGIPNSSSTIVAGSLGAGKTLLSLHFLMAGVRQGEMGCYLGFHESHQELLNKGARFNLDLQEAVHSEKLTLLALSSVQVEPDIVIAQIEKCLASGARRFVIDGFAELERVCRLEGRSLDFTGAIVAYLKEREITSVYTHEIPRITGPELDLSDTPFILLAENLLLLRQVEYNNQLHRVISVLKMRDSDYDHTIREFTIVDGQGIRVLSPLQTQGGLLSNPSDGSDKR